MAQLTIEKTYQDGETPTQLDIDNIIDSIESFLNVTRLADDNIQDASITTSTVFSEGSITAGKIAASAVTTAKILDGAVITGKFQESAVTTAKITDANITTAKIAASTITADNFGVNSITPSKLYNDASTDSAYTYVTNSGTDSLSYTATSYPSGLDRYAMTCLNADAIFMYSNLQSDASFTNLSPRVGFSINGTVTGYQHFYSSHTGITLSGSQYATLYFPSCSIRHLYNGIFDDKTGKVGVAAYLGPDLCKVGISGYVSTYILEIQ